MKLAVSLALVISLLTLGSPVFAGKFVMQDVWDVPIPSSIVDTTRVLVGARALYEGLVDADDKSWAIQTNLYHLGMETPGTPYYGSGVAANMKIEVDPYQYGASESIPNCNARGEGQTYEGTGVVAIYHQWKPDISDGTTGNQTTDCTSPPSDPPPGEEGGTESPPGDGSGTGTGGCRGCTPILVDLNHRGFLLTDLAGGVQFDIDRDGTAETVSWSQPGAGDAWLALDRNWNGAIDDGGELFGNFTDQPPTSEPNGYLALAVFDEDGDGRISDSDSVFGDLRLWTDRNHDGLSQPFELSTLAVAGIQWLSTRPVESRRRDPHGNEFRYTAAVGLVRGMTHSVDVYLLVGP